MSANYDTAELVRRLALMLDAAQPALEAEGRREKAREAGKSLRQITKQEHAKAARELVAEAEAWLIANGRGAA